MADIFLSNGDISSSMYGDIAVVMSYDDITQSAANNILTVYGENQFHPGIGNMAHLRRLKVADSSLETIQKDCINAIMTDNRIESVVSMIVSYDEDNANNVNISFTIKAIDGTLMSNNITINM